MFKNMKGIDIRANMVRLGRMYVFVNPAAAPNRLDIEAALSRGSRVIHIFYSGDDQIIDVKNFYDVIVSACGDRYTAKNPLRMYIHLPKAYPNLKTVVDYYMREAEAVDFVRWKTILEKNPTTFAVPGQNMEISHHRFHVCNVVVGYDFGQMVTSILETRSTPIYSTDIRPPAEYSGAIANSVQRLCPELFRDEIIARFKKVTPAGILKTFKNDDEIWDYVTKSGEWSPTERRSEKHA